MENLPNLENMTDGGLQYPSIRHVDATMKISWFKRIHLTDEVWAFLPCIYKMDMIYMYGDIFKKASEFG